ncbi:MAG: hypothetical protein ACU84H_15700 [Gammaproteobacteria bacterium]
MPISSFERHRSLIMVLLNLTCGTIIWSSAQASREWAAECDEDYSECGGSNLPNSCDNTDGMISEINDSLSNWHHGWYFTGGNAWPQDWRDADTVSGGLDNPYMDAIGRGDLSVWSGHGTGAANEPNGRWEIAMGHRHDRACNTTSPDQMKFGEQASDGFGNNGDNEYVIMDASCSAIEGELDQVWENWGPGILMRSHQGLAFHDSPDDADDRLEEFIENIDDGDSNKTAWLDAGENCFLWWCDNSPMVITFGENEGDANDRHNNETMRSPRADAPSGWGGHYRWSFIDNGSC